MGILKTGSSAISSGETTAVAESVALVRQQCDEILAQLKTTNERLAQLAARESELRAVLERDAVLDGHQELLAKVLDKEQAVSAAEAAVSKAVLNLDPFPYAVIDGVLPTALYRALLRGIPPVELFTSKQLGKQHLDVPFSLAPTYSHRVWRFMTDVVVAEVIAPRLLAKFRAAIDDWIALNWPGLDPRSVELHSSGGRIMFRRRGYRIAPHRDPKWGFITCILYLARKNDSEAWGTQIYAVDKDEEAKNAAPHWIDPKQCRLVEDVGFRPNRLLVFLNSTGAHGAHIPADAQPENLERYIYQFRIGPSLETISMLRSMLPEERQSRWAGKGMVDY